MDGGISNMISSVLSNPDALNQIMTLMPAVTQMMNSGGSNNQTNPNPNSNQTPEKIVETTAVNKSDAPGSNISAISAESLMANEKVMNALKNLIIALNDASVEKPAINNIENNSPNNNDAVMASAFQNINPDSISNIANMLNSALKSQGNNTTQENNVNNTSGGIEKTLNDTFKNFSSVTNPESDHKSKLLLALKPFLRDARQTKIDTAIKYMNAAKLFNQFGKNGFV